MQFAVHSIQQSHPKMARLVTFDKYHWHSSPPSFSLYFTIRIEIPKPIPVYILRITIEELCMNLLRVMCTDDSFVQQIKMQTISHMARHAYNLIQSTLKMLEKSVSGYQFVEYRHFIATPADHTLIQQTIQLHSCLLKSHYKRRAKFKTESNRPDVCCA